MKPQIALIPITVLGLLHTAGQAQESIPAIMVDASQVRHRVSRYLTGACIEDVNHEVYGGIDSQMIFGESFDEPPPPPELKGFAVYGGRWTLAGSGGIEVAGGDGPKIVCHEPVFAEGEASVDVLFDAKGGGNAGFIVKVTDAGKGHDQFNGYEISLEPAGTLVLGRHRQNWEPIRRVPCGVPLNEWITLAVRMQPKALEVLVNGKSVTRYADTAHPLETGAVGLRAWQCGAQFRNLAVTTGGVRRGFPFAYAKEDRSEAGVSGMWRAVRRGSAEGAFALDEAKPFVGRQSQRFSFTGGAGEIGIENQGLNRWGMHFFRGKVYEGFLYARAAETTEIFVALESSDGSAIYAEKRLKLAGNEWEKLEFTLAPETDSRSGRFAIKLKQPGAVTVGYALLQPGEWGRFKGLPVRKDVGEGLVNQGITVLRQGGCMINAAEYRWKKMIGPRAQRPPCVGWWYPHSSNGWGIFDFLNFCEAAGFLGVPDVNIGETPADMADFVEYVNGPADSEWGRKRAADGHPAPYGLRCLQIGNEEQMNENYWRKFKPIAEAVWARDRNIVLVVGDFAYGRPIEDPMKFTGSAGGNTSLDLHRRILQLAKQHDAEVWFDVHIGTDGPRPNFGGTFSFIDALQKVADGAKHRVVIFEFNAGNHSQRRALANAAAINAVERDGRLPIATSANCLQVDGHNDNDWNQGLLFLNQSQVWLQPPGFVTRMISRNYQPLLVKSEVRNAGDTLDVSAKRSEDGKTLVLQVVNFSAQPVEAVIRLEGFAPSQPVARIEELAGPLDARNTADNPHRITTRAKEWRHGITNGMATCRLPPHSFTVARFE